MRAVVVHNPTAGTGRHTAEALVAAVEAAGYTVTYRSTKDGDFAEPLRERCDLVVAAGGDGTVAKVAARILPGSGVPLAIVPLGTANNIARSLHIAGTPVALAATWRTGATRLLDIGVVRGPWGERPFVEAVGIGMLAQALGGAVGGKPDGMAAGRDALRRALAEGKPERVHLNLDGDVTEGDFLMVEVLNAGYTGPALRLAPDASIGDGLLDVLCVRPDDRAAMLAWLDGDPGAAGPALDTRRARAIALTWQALPLRFDDAFFPAWTDEPGLVVGLRGQAVTVLAPPAPRPAAQRTRDGKKAEAVNS